MCSISYCRFLITANYGFLGAQLSIKFPSCWTAQYLWPPLIPANGSIPWGCGFQTGPEYMLHSSKITFQYLRLELALSFYVYVIPTVALLPRTVPKQWGKCSYFMKTIEWGFRVSNWVFWPKFHTLNLHKNSILPCQVLSLKDIYDSIDERSHRAIERWEQGHLQADYTVGGILTVMIRRRGP